MWRSPLRSTKKSPPAANSGNRSSRSASSQRNQVQTRASSRSGRPTTSTVVKRGNWTSPIDVFRGTALRREEEALALASTSRSTDSNDRGGVSYWKGYEDENALLMSDHLMVPPVGPSGIPDIPYLTNNVDQTITMHIINDAWKDKEEGLHVIRTNLRRTFRECMNPFAEALFFAVHNPDYRQSKLNLSLAYQIIKELKKWLLESEIVTLQRQYLKADLQIVAFMIATSQKASNFTDMICDVFRLDFIREHLTGPILTLCRNKQYQEACHVSTFVDITAGITIHDFAIPLLLQDREIVMSEYVAEHQPMQIELLKFLNKMNAEVDVTKALLAYCTEHKIEGYKHEKLERRQFDRMLARFQEKYKDANIPPPVVAPPVIPPPMIIERTAFLKRMEEMDKNPTGLLARSLPQTADRNRITLTNNLSSSSPSTSTTAGLAEFAAGQFHKGLPIRTVFEPKLSEVWDETESLSSPSSSELEFDSVEDDGYHFSIPINRQDINYFYSPEGINIFLKHVAAAQIAQKQRSGRMDDFLIVTIDAKWRCYGRTKQGASLLVIGLMDEVFILDLFRLKKYTRHPDASWEKLRAYFFMNPGLVKISANHDCILSILSKTHGSWSNIIHDMKLFVDLDDVAQELVKRNKEFFPYPLKGREAGFDLAELVRLCFGRPLNRYVLMSNWEHRPLSKAQMHFAAVDGLAIFMVVNVMIDRSKGFNIEFEDIVKASMSPHTLPSPDFFAPPGRPKIFPTGNSN